MNLTDLPLLLTVDEFARDVLRSDRKTAYSMIHRGEIRTVSVGRLIKVPRSAVAEWLGDSDPGPPGRRETPLEGGALSNVPVEWNGQGESTSAGGPV